MGREEGGGAGVGGREESEREKEKGRERKGGEMVLIEDLRVPNL